MGRILSGWGGRVVPGCSRHPDNVRRGAAIVQLNAFGLHSPQKPPDSYLASRKIDPSTNALKKLFASSDGRVAD